MIACYARISTEDQSRYSISDQMRKCRQKAQSEDVKEYIDDGYSGEFLDRPAMIQLRADVKAGLITKVICLDPDRLARKLVAQLIVSEEIEKRAELVFVNGEYARTPEGMLFYQMRGAVAEFEKAKINERMSNGRRQKARQGKVVKDYHVYGYGYNRDTGQLYIIEEEAKVVRMIYDFLVSPMLTLNGKAKGINSIALYLTEEKYSTKKGATVWHRQVVRQILMNRAYIGEFYQNRYNTENMLGNKHRHPDDKVKMKERPKEEWIRIPCPSIITEIQFEHAQRLLAEGKRRWAKASPHTYLLSGLLRCGECGNTMTGRHAKNWKKMRREYTDIKNTAGFKNKGCGHVVPCEDIDDVVWEKILGALNDPEQVAAASEIETVSYEESEVERVQSQLDKIKIGRKRLLKLFADGSKDIGEAELREAMRETKAEEESLTAKLTELQAQAIEKTSNQYGRQLIQEVAAYYLSLNELTVDDKQKMIRHIVKEVRVYKDKIIIDSF